MCDKLYDPHMIHIWKLNVVFKSFTIKNPTKWTLYNLHVNISCYWKLFSNETKWKDNKIKIKNSGISALNRIY